MARGKRTRRRQRAWPTVLLAALVALAALALGYLLWSRGGPAPEGSGPAVSASAAAALQPSQPDQTGTPTPTQAPQSPDQVSASPAPQITDQPQPSQSPSAPASPAPAPAGERVQALMADMTVRDKVCQMMMVMPTAITGVDKVVAAGETTRKGLENYPVGGLLYDRTNMVSQEQVKTMLANTQSYTRIPLLLTCDEEGGRVNRLMSTVGTTRLQAMLDYQDQGAEKAEENARTIATDMSRLGFNLDLAPVADVWSNPKNTVIGDRAYSDDFQQAAQLIPAAVAGFREGGVACALKHFPGHGDTAADSHYGSAYVTKTLDELRAQELLPFQAGIDAGADVVMMGHIIVKSVDEEPAVFSYTLVTELLRGELGFQGVVMTDAMRMQAITDHYTSGQAAVKAVQAGVDMILCPADLKGAVDALVQAVERGDIPGSRLDESVARILTLKMDRGLL